MKAFFCKILCKADSAIAYLQCCCSSYFAPVLDLIIRLYMAKIFFSSGWLKVQSFLDGHWERTVMLFEDIHPVPFIPAELAAVAGTTTEFSLSILLAFGLFGRFAALGLLAMTLVIQFGVPAEYEISNPQHYVWMMLLGVILTRGAGKLSIDHWLMKRSGCKTCEG